MKKLSAILILVLSVLLVSCHKPEVAFKDMSPTPTATISGDKVAIHLGSDMIDSACFVQPVSKVEGDTVYVWGYRRLKEIGHEYVVNLPASANSQAVTIVWINPDGSRVTIPTTKQ